ncbi:hypothetical protein V7128_01110 [Neobacillus vireti]|uniref:hypothetical protein n=1 Tax=Neobacillus vireti TaxID=220686 RepID=UPI002FFD871F
MRSFKSSVYGYARRQARREVYKAYDGYTRYKNTNDKKKQEETEMTMGDFFIGVGIVFGIIILFSSL